MTDIVIRPATIEDAQDVASILSGPQAVAGTLQLPHLSKAKMRERMASPPDGLYSLVAELSGEVVGTIALNKVKNPRRNHVGTIGMAVSDNHTGRGIGSRLVDSVIDMAENWLALTRIELTVFTDNKAAIALYKKHRFTIEGEAERFAFRNGEYVNAYYMARVISKSH